MAIALMEFVFAIRYHSERYTIYANCFELITCTPVHCLSVHLSFYEGKCLPTYKSVVFCLLVSLFIFVYPLTHHYVCSVCLLSGVTVRSFLVEWEEGRMIYNEAIVKWVHLM